MSLRGLYNYIYVSLVVALEISEKTLGADGLAR